MKRDVSLMTLYRKQLLMIPGDGVGPEIFDAMRALVTRLAQLADIEVRWGQAGYGVWKKHGSTMAPELLEQASRSDAVLFGAEDTEGYSWMPPEERPASALLQLRKTMAGFANLRPVRVLPAMEDRSPLRPELVRGVDIMIVRELLGGLYFGRPRGIERTSSGARAVDTMVYEAFEIERVARVAFALARARNGRLCSVDKANVLSCSYLWRETVSALASEYPDVQLTHMYVDNCATQLIRRPSQFDVIVTENTFGDILSDAAAVLAGSIGMLPSACLGTDLNGALRGLYEPVHGSAPDIAGRGVANPLGTILSLAMALRHSLAKPDLAAAVEQATSDALAAGIMTPDLGGHAITAEMAAGVLDRL
jgi:3-isopropylmalate dehydrogenase